MAVEARHLNLFPPQMLSNRGLMMNGVDGIGNAYSMPAGFGLLPPLSGMETVVPMYCSAMTETVLLRQSAIKSDSGLTYAVPVSRKRSRDAINPMAPSLPAAVHLPAVNNRRGSFTFLGEDLSFQLQQQQLEIDRFVSQHTEKVRIEIEERRKRYSRRMAAALEENIVKKLKSKDAEIEKIGKLNLALEERVKSLCVENQIWRNMAESNEATANALRCNLEQVLAQVQQEQADDAQSSFNETVAGESPRRNQEGGDRCRNRMCRRCGEKESCVLVLPCRHLCLCRLCGSSLDTCPVCKSTKTGSVHVNMSAR